MQHNVSHSSQQPSKVRLEEKFQFQESDNALIISGKIELQRLLILLTDVCNKSV
jgi:hypothetical protein